MAVVVRQMLAKITKIEKPVNAAKQVIRWNVVSQVEGVKQMLLTPGKHTQRY
jgi:hypothetical protein